MCSEHLFLYTFIVWPRLRSGTFKGLHFLSILSSLLLSVTPDITLLGWSKHLISIIEAYSLVEISNLATRGTEGSTSASQPCNVIGKESEQKEKKSLESRVFSQCFSKGAKNCATIKTGVQSKNRARVILLGVISFLKDQVQT